MAKRDAVSAIPTCINVLVTSYDIVVLLGFQVPLILVVVVDISRTVSNIAASNTWFA